MVIIINTKQLNLTYFIIHMEFTKKRATLNTQLN